MIKYGLLSLIRWKIIKITFNPIIVVTWLINSILKKGWGLSHKHRTFGQSLDHETSYKANHQLNIKLIQKINQRNLKELLEHHSKLSKLLIQENKKQHKKSQKNN